MSFWKGTGFFAGLVFETRLYTAQPRLTSDFWSCCFYTLNSGITGICLQDQQNQPSLHDEFPRMETLRDTAPGGFWDHIQIIRSRAQSPTSYFYWNIWRLRQRRMADTLWLMSEHRSERNMGWWLVCGLSSCSTNALGMKQCSWRTPETEDEEASCDASWQMEGETFSSQVTYFQF